MIKIKKNFRFIALFLYFTLSSFRAYATEFTPPHEEYLLACAGNAGYYQQPLLTIHVKIKECELFKCFVESAEYQYHPHEGIPQNLINMAHDLASPEFKLGEGANGLVVPGTYWGGDFFVNAYHVGDDGYGDMIALYSRDLTHAHGFAWVYINRYEHIDINEYPDFKSTIFLNEVKNHSQKGYQMLCQVF